MTHNRTDNARSNTATALAELAGDLFSLMIREHHKIQQELNCISQLVDDASKSLMTSFQRISSGPDRLGDMPAGAGPANATASTDTAEHFKKNYSDVVTALQFDDIVQQINRHAQNRTRHIQQLFTELSARLDDLKASDFEYSADLEETIRLLRNDIRALGVELEKESPAQQARLAEGRIELF